MATIVSILLLLLLVIFILRGNKKNSSTKDTKKVQTVKQKGNNTADNNRSKVIDTTLDKSPFEIGDFQKDLNTYLEIKTRRFPIEYNSVPSITDRIRCLFESFSQTDNSKYVTRSYAVPSNRILFERDKGNNLEIDFHEFTLFQAYDFFDEICRFCEQYEFDFVIIHGYKHGTVIKDMVNQYRGNYFKKVPNYFNPGATLFYTKTRTRDWISYFKKEADAQIDKIHRLTREKEKENDMLAGEMINELLSRYKNTNTVLLEYFLNTINYDNQKYISKIYSLFYSNTDIIQRDFIIKLLTGTRVAYNQSTQCIVNKELLTIIFCIHAYKNSSFVDGQIINFDIMKSTETNAIKSFNGLYCSIDYRLLSFIINNLNKSVEFDVELASIMRRYSKLTEEQSRSICDVLSIIFCGIKIAPGNRELQIDFSDDFVCFILIMGKFDSGFISYYNLIRVIPIRLIYCEKLLESQNEAQRFLDLSSEQQRWYVEIKKKSKAFYQIPQNLVNQEFRDMLFQDFPKIKELYGK